MHTPAFVSHTNAASQFGLNSVPEKQEVLSAWTFSLAPHRVNVSATASMSQSPEENLRGECQCHALNTLLTFQGISWGHCRAELGSSAIHPASQGNVSVTCL